MKAVDVNNPPEDMPSLPQVAYNALSTGLKARTHRYLPENPARLIGDFAKNMAALNKFISHSKEEEKLILQMKAAAVELNATEPREVPPPATK